MTPLFWIAIAIDAVLLVIVLVLSLSRGDAPGGGREMAVFFSIVVPAIVVAGGAALFLLSESKAKRAVALFMVAAPGLFVATTRLRSAVIDAQVQRNAEGRGYFADPKLQRAGVAVIRRDVQALEAIENPINYNAKGTEGMTLMDLAVSQADGAPAGSPVIESSLEVVRALLARGADPNAGLATATKLLDATILTALLDAGAQPGFSDGHGPVVFTWLNVMPIGNLIVLLDHRLDTNLTDGIGTPLIVAAAQQDRWECVLLLMDRGADPARADRRGTRLGDVVQSRMESSTSRSGEMKADIARVKTRLDQR